ncbi:DUF654-domain-containing protein [Aulographum hederae CBS 113979]|uniref:DUF654-domain-containing protein n=1 Tax=Aulographum hederae CBS 113979 TaxID=1176131 RepID=A0A6G1H062_9PEZI|nr:DUF654-domain-containing protein [Aulographum hederae CBS 113979]
MSSRALRKVQREREEQKRLQKAQEEQQDEEEESDDEASSAPAVHKGLFAMLNEDDEEDEEDDDEPQETPLRADPVPEAPASNKVGAKKKKKKKKKAKAEPEATTQSGPHSTATSSQLDEIDLALQALAMEAPRREEPSEPAKEIPPETVEICRLLSIDSQYLHATNEMRRLFGRAALENDQDEEQGAGDRNRARRAQQQNQGGRNLRSITLRKNPFIHGKEEWPPGTSGGLSMELVEKRDDGSVEYRFVHSPAYQDVQRQYLACVESMDPNRILELLHYNPYHIATLFQAAEMAKHHREHTRSRDLLERALFNYGRVIHSSFSKNLAEGKTRLSFQRPENREFWLIVQRYVSNLSSLGTWRTAYEWTKLLLSLDPAEDPLGTCVMFDQYALRSRQYQPFLDLVNSEFFKSRWIKFPNIQTSAALAYSQTQQPQLARSTLKASIETHPWFATRILQELDISPLPPPIWGHQPASPLNALLSEMIRLSARNVWNTPEATSLLVEVAHTAQPGPATIDTAHHEITANLARQVLLLDEPPLIALLPRSMTSTMTSNSDPIPPEDSIISYSTDAPGPAGATNNVQNTPSGIPGGSQGAFDRLIDLMLPFVRRGAANPGNEAGRGLPVDGIIAEDILAMLPPGDWDEEETRNRINELIENRRAAVEEDGSDEHSDNE